MYQVLLCFNGINREKLGAVKNRILNNSLLGDDDKVSMLPKSYTELLHAMTGFKPEELNRSSHYQGGDEITAGAGGVVFAQTSTSVPKIRGIRATAMRAGSLATGLRTALI
jgi:hypothetical protein